MAKSLAHIGLTVVDLDKMLAFYVDVLGLKIGARTPHPKGGKIVYLEGADGEMLEMIQYAEPKPSSGRDRQRTGLHHFGLLTDDIYKERDRLAALGLEFDGEIKPNTGDELVVHFWDPEGNRLHLTQMRPRAAG